MTASTLTRTWSVKPRSSRLSPSTENGACCCGFQVMAYRVRMCTLVYPCSLIVTGMPESSLTMYPAAGFTCESAAGCLTLALETSHLMCAHGRTDSLFEIVGGEQPVLSLSEITVSNCSSNRVGGTVWAYNNAKVVVHASSFEGSRAVRSGGAFAILGSTLEVSDSTFKGCSSALRGGAIDADDFTPYPADPIHSHVKISSSAFQDCDALAGGAVSTNKAAVQINTSSFQRCASSLRGGAALFRSDGEALDGAVAYTSTVTMRECEFRSNTAGEHATANHQEHCTCLEH